MNLDFENIDFSLGNDDLEHPKNWLSIPETVIIEIHNEKDLKEVLTDLIEFRKAKKRLKDQKKEALQPATEFKKSIEDEFEKHEIWLDSLEHVALSKIWEYCDNIAFDEPVRVDNGYMKKEKVWSWEVENIDKVPVEFLKIDYAEVEKQIKMGIRNIPGINIHQTVDIKFRGKN